MSITTLLSALFHWGHSDQTRLLLSSVDRTAHPFTSMRVESSMKSSLRTLDLTEAYYSATDAMNLLWFLLTVNNQKIIFLATRDDAKCDPKVHSGLLPTHFVRGRFYHVPLTNKIILLSQKSFHYIAVCLRTLCTEYIVHMQIFNHNCLFKMLGIKAVCSMPTK